MARRWMLAGVLACAAVPELATAQVQARRSRVDVQHYVVNAQVDPANRTVQATAEVRFNALDDNLTTTAFELNNAMNVSRVVDAAGRQVPASRNQQDFTVSLSFNEPLKKGSAQALTFSYDGRLSGEEESPVYGLKFAALGANSGYLLYPARWFPVNDYTVDRYTADFRITVPAGFKVVSSGLSTTETSASGGTTYIFRTTQPTFPGSIAVVQGDPVVSRNSGVNTDIWFREGKAMAVAYGEETAKIMTFLTGIFGLPPQAGLTLVEIDANGPSGYSAPGMLFLSSRSIGSSVNTRVLANQIARQWWGALVSPVTRNHLWLTYGPARYAELLYIESTNGPAAMESEIRDTYVEALTVESPPMSQAARLEDYSPELIALVGGKGAATLNMLRAVVGDDNFKKIMKAVPEQFAWKSISTEDFRKVTESVIGQNLGWFFIQWVESNGAPEFKMDYTVFRTAKGFRVMGKISQDLDTFRMPVDLKIETEGNPEDKRVEVVGTSSEFIVETFGKPKIINIDPNNRLLRFSDPIRVAVAIRRGEQFAEIGEFGEALKEYQKALDVNRSSSLAHYRVGEVFFLQNNYQSAANAFREALNGDLEPKWTEVWARINLGKIFDVTGQRDRARNEYQLALRTKDNTQGAQEEAAKYLKAPYERPRQNY
ncbi:MAG: M1 family aminopeptidase [Bryobacteraceae bacterium]|nr:M1 family aminopeptidase [Bryobacteraceae bacterium]